MLYTADLLKDDFENAHITYLRELEINLSEGQHHSGKGNVVRLLATN